ncbi:hypothetical protein B0H16DRAFT_1324859, partial [Mycena metata]
DPFFGRGLVAGYSSRFIIHLFQCPAFLRDFPSGPTSHLTFSIAFTLYHTQLEDFVLYTALVLLLRLKYRFPNARGCGHRLFFAAFIVASKVLSDKPHSNKAWPFFTQHMFTLREVNGMEREFCRYIDWQLFVNHSTVSDLSIILFHYFAPP